VELNPGPPKKSQVKTVTVNVSSSKPQTATKKKGKKSRKNNNTKGPRLTSVARNYLTSLLFPPISTSRIPDICSIKTSEVKFACDFLLTINANGFGGCYVGLFPGLGGSFYKLEGSTSLDTGFVYGANQTIPGITGFTNSFMSARLVSASFEAELTSSSLNDGGLLMGASIVGGPTWTETPGATSTQILAMRDNTCHRLKDGMFIRWRPLDNTADEFAISTSTTYVVGGLLLHVSGGNPGSVLRCRIVINGEAIPTSDTLSYQETSGSPVDLNGYQQVREILVSTPSFSTFEQVKNIVSNGVDTLGGAAMAAVTSLASLAIARQQRRLQMAPAA